MRLEQTAGLAVLLALAACGGAKKDEAAKTDTGSPAATAPAAGAASGTLGKINPGEWEMTVESAGVPDPRMPAAVAEAMKKGMTVTNRTCVTKEEASKPPADMMAGQGHKDCTYTEYQASGGNLHSAIACGAQSGTKSTITTDGKFGGDTLDLRSKVETGGPGPTMTITSHISGHRIGDCSKAAG
jgi:hypothetical protein